MQTKEQAAKFIVVGVINTFIDYLILNILIYVGFTAFLMLSGQKFLIANIISVSVAMINSFILNRQWAFNAEKGNIYGQIIKFIVVTVIGMFVVHQIVFNIFYYQLGYIFNFIVQIARFLNLTFLSKDFIILNFSKALAISVSMVWNFIGYKFLVFKR